MAFSSIIRRLRRFYRLSFRFCRLAVSVVTALAAIGVVDRNSSAASENEPRAASATYPFALDRRVAWTTSRVIGSPDPPLPYRVVRAYPRLTLRQPLYFATEPGTKNFLVIEHVGTWAGPGRISRVAHDPKVVAGDILLTMDRLPYGLAFHPQYLKNGYLYVFSNGPVTAAKKMNRISRYTVQREVPNRCDPGSEQVILEWESDGHNGGDLAFGSDGFLYISSGDGTSDSDTLDTGQDNADLLGAVLRIDIDHPAGGKAYSIPRDNPFVGDPNARPEIWAFGLRNPWRMSFDSRTGQLWVGNNGQDLWESVHLIRRGENHGWSVLEGSHPFRPQRQRGSATFARPAAEHHHAEARSLTGGVVYHGRQLPALAGAYIYGDYSTGRIWALHHPRAAGFTTAVPRELADTALQITGFGIDPDGELVIVDHGGGLYRLEPAPADDKPTPFPKKLSDTGLFQSVAEHRPHAALIPYSVNAPLWSDGAAKDRFIALPGLSHIDFTENGGWNFPDGAVLVKTFSFGARRVETRLLTKQQGEWQGYSYEWNDDQSDATLVTSAGADRVFTPGDVAVPDGRRSQNWRFPSRAECMVCHTRAANFVLGLSTLQMNKEHDYGHMKANQLAALERLGVFRVAWSEHIAHRLTRLDAWAGAAMRDAAGRLVSSLAHKPSHVAWLPKRPGNYPRLVDPFDIKNKLDLRARSYLHANCAHCHVEAGGGNSLINLAFTADRAAMQAFDARPQHAAQEITDPRVIAPGDPDRSVLLQRMSRRGAGQMPPLASHIADEQAVALVKAWIAADKKPAPPTVATPWLMTTAYAVPKETTNQGSGYFSLIEGHNGRLYIGAAKYGHNAYLVEFDPRAKKMGVAVDAHKEMGTTATGFAAQAKIHTRNNVGASGRIYFGTKQGYPEGAEKRSDYAGGYPMVFDPATGKTRVYPIPLPHQGIISVTPDESRGVAYISTCSDERPIESAHFMVLDLATGKYRDLVDSRHMFAFIVIDHLGRAYHPLLGGQIARYDPKTGKLERLDQTIDGRPPAKDSHLADEHSHPINWEISPDRKTLWAVAMSGNALFSYDLTGEGRVVAGRSHGRLIADAKDTDCRAMCVGPDGTVWAGVAATIPDRGQNLHLVSYRPGERACRDHGPLAIGNPDYTPRVDAKNKPLPWHHGVEQRPDGKLVPKHSIMAICAARDGTVYLTTLAPFTLHEIRGVGKHTAGMNPAARMPRVAVVTTVWHHNSHSDIIAARMLQSHTLDGRGDWPKLDLASLYVDQTPANDKSRELAARHGFRLCQSVAEALTLGGEKLAVDGVLLIAEHGNYPDSTIGSTQYPKRRLFDEIVKVFERSGRVVPVFFDKHLSDNWDDARAIYDAAGRLKIPMMAGSSLPTLWRYPAADVRDGAPLKEIVATSYHRLDAYGFHALEMVQCLVERRHGGESGIRQVRCLEGEAVWAAGRAGRFDLKLLDEAATRFRQRPLARGEKIQDLARKPVLFTIEYRDGLRASVLTMDGGADWAAAWRYADGKTDSTLFWTQEERPMMHFSFLLDNIERLVHSGRPVWPLERTLLTSGALDALLVSRHRGGEAVTTPYLGITYTPTAIWREPPPPPPGRPVAGP
jgi:uncharacterized repeat protein (TIGR03806 family)